MVRLMVAALSILAVFLPLAETYGLADLFDPAAGASKDAAKNVVTWDKHSLFVHGERILFYSGEFHPFRYGFQG